jgi:Family of unknown function (DUF6308)
VIAPGASLAGPADCVPWLALGQLFGAFAGIGGVGFAKMTKALHPKRPALIPMLDSIVRKYLQDDDPGAPAPFGQRALGLVCGYKNDLDLNGAVVRAVRQELSRRGHELTEVRILDLLILSAAGAVSLESALLQPPVAHEPFTHQLELTAGPGAARPGSPRTCKGAPERRAPSHENPAHASSQILDQLKRLSR